MLFNKNDNGSVELYELSGTFQAATPFSAVATEVISAQMEVARVVGDAVVAKAEAIYAQENISSENQEYLDMVRRPVAFLAICNFSRITGLTHGASGRKMTVGDNEKVPFEWMIDRDDREMRERYYRSLDALFGYLTAKNDSDWKATPIYQRTAQLLVPSLSAMEQVYPVAHSQYTFFMMVPLMEETQAKLLSEAGGTEIPEAQLPAARRFIVLKALVLALRRWALSVFPTEVARQFAPSYQGNKEKRVATTEEIDWAVAKLEEQASQAESEVLAEVKENPYKGFPLIPENDPKNKYFTV